MRASGQRFLITALLALLMFIPLFFAGEVVDSRARYQDEAERQVGEEWGGRQVIAGPVMVIPVEGPVTRTERREVTDPDTGALTTRDVEVTETGRLSPLYLLPERLNATVATETEIRRRGIFEVPVYTAEAVLDADWAIADVSSQLTEGAQPVWEETYLRIGLSTNRALRGAAELTADGRDLTLEPEDNTRETGGIRAMLGDPRGVAATSLRLGLNGADQLWISPVGRVSEVRMTSDWPHPSFDGAFLPDSFEISEDGFEALWTIPHLARPMPQIARSDQTERGWGSAFGVSYFQPNDFYQKAYRAARYGILFIALTFLTVLLIENRTDRPTHPVQYILIGLAQSIFVLLMVAYAEQIGFGPAYLLSAGATIALLFMFGALALKLGRRTWVLGATLLLLYAVLYLILRSTDYALLAGATLAFLALAGTMYLTRNEDWYGPPKPPKPAKAPPPAAPGA